MIPFGLTPLCALVHLVRPREPLFATKGEKPLCSPEKQLSFGLSWSPPAMLLFAHNSQPCTHLGWWLSQFLCRVPFGLETVLENWCAMGAGLK